EFRSKSKQDLCTLERGCRGHMFALEVTEELDTWPEQENRNRKWLNVRVAFRLCRYEWMCQALEEFLKVMVEDGKLEKKVESPPTMPVADVVTECEIISQNCHVNTLSGQHHSMHCWSSLVLGLVCCVCWDSEMLSCFAGLVLGLVWYS
ncbi:hypothetical protein CFOL_v3_26399, partial [Cephalotus follicularis]